MTSKTLALLLLGLVVPAVSSAQALKAGTWTGTVYPPEGDSASVTYDVTVNGDSLGIVIHAGEHGDFTAELGHYADKTISFTFTPGIGFHCKLTRNDAGDYAGSCFGDDGAEAQMTMVPPKG